MKVVELQSKAKRSKARQDGRARMDDDSGRLLRLPPQPGPLIRSKSEISPMKSDHELSSSTPGVHGWYIGARLK